jgi:hypothetical protein
MVQMVGGVMLATNTATGPAALALAGSLLPSTLAGQDAWSGTEQPQAGPVLRPDDRIPLLKNLGLMGGLLLAAVDTEGKPGLAWRTGHLAGHAQDSVKRAAHTTAKETKRAARLTAKEARRAAEDARRTARTAARESKLTVKSARAGGLLPG